MELVPDVETPTLEVLSSAAIDDNDAKEDE